MRVLALESASRLCSVALMIDGRVEWRLAADDARNSEVLLPLARALLAEADVALSSLDGIAFGAGPGAFTGLRVACGVAQGLAFGADLPVVGVGSLDLIAESVRSAVVPTAEVPDLAAPVAGAATGATAAADAGAAPLRVLSALDARMGEVYWATLEAAGPDWRTLAGPALCRPEAVPVPTGQGWLGAGEAFVLFREVLEAQLTGHCVWVASADLLPRADRLARLGQHRLAHGQGMAPEHAHPIYVRDKVAQTEQERRTAATPKSA